MLQASGCNVNIHDNRGAGSSWDAELYAVIPGQQSPWGGTEHTDHELTHTGSMASHWVGPARGDLPPHHCSTSKVSQVLHSHLHIHSVQFPSPLTCNRMQHPGILPLFPDTAAHLAKCIGSLKQKEARTNLLLLNRLPQSYLSSLDGQWSQVASHSSERHTRSSPRSHHRKKQGNLWNWEQTRIFVLPEERESGRRPDFKIAMKKSTVG